VLKLNADYYTDKYQKLQEKAGTQQASKRSPDITRYHPRSPEITRDHPRSPEPSSREKDTPRLYLTSAAPRLYPG